MFSNRKLRRLAWAVTLTSGICLQIPTCGLTDRDFATIFQAALSTGATSIAQNIAGLLAPPA